MRILIDNTELAGGGVRGVGKNCGPSGFRVNDELMTQESAPIRSAQRTHYNRNNAGTVVTFDVRREHSGVSAAEAYLLTHAADLTRRGTVTFESKDARGKLVRVQLANAVIAITRHRYEGVSTYHSYEIRGGKLTRSNEA